MEQPEDHLTKVRRHITQCNYQMAIEHARTGYNRNEENRLEYLELWAQACSWQLDLKPLTL